jgi:NADH-quinone oxidoreductase subunit I
MNNAFELSTDDRFEGLMLHKEELALPNAYYHKIHPTDAAEVDARLAAARARTAAKVQAAAGGESAASSGTAASVKRDAVPA